MGARMEHIRKDMPKNDCGCNQRHEFAGRGIGYVDLHLLASTALTPGTLLWTRDKRLAAAARELHLSHESEGG